MSVMATFASIFVLIVIIVQLMPLVEYKLSLTVRGCITLMCMDLAYYILCVNMLHVYFMIITLPLFVRFIYNDYKKLMTKIKETKDDSSSGQQQTDEE